MGKNCPLKQCDGLFLDYKQTGLSSVLRIGGDAAGRSEWLVEPTAQEHPSALKLQLYSITNSSVTEYTHIQNYPKRDFQIFSSPDIHATGVLSKVIEILSVHGKQSSSHCRRPRKGPDCAHPTEPVINCLQSLCASGAPKTSCL